MPGADLNLLFDLDGTLTDPKEGIVRSIHYAMGRMGIALGDVNLDWCVGPPLKQSLESLLGEAHPGRADEALQLYRERYRDLGMYENSVYPAIPSLLAGLARESALYVATSKPVAFAEKILRHFRLSGHFKGVYGSEMDGTNSDKAELIRHILLKENLNPQSVLMIGDREHDMIGARKNGVRGIGVLWGYGSREELQAAGAQALLEKPADLQAYLAAQTRAPQI